MPNVTGHHAIVVDDDAMILMDACAILEDAGFCCHEAGTSGEAIELLTEHAEWITLLFSDVEMPGDIGGFGLAHHVDKHWPHIEIVIASGRITPVAGDLPDKVTFISKPFNARLVHDHLREQLPAQKQPELLKQQI